MSEFIIQVNASPQLFLKNGIDFLEAAWRCAGTDESGAVQIMKDGTLVMIPSATVVNAVFSIEMFLKAILRKAGIHYPDRGRDGHDLFKLFKLLGDSQRETTIINQFVGYSKDGKSLFEEFAGRHANDFVDIRYYVEEVGWARMDPLTVIRYAFNLGQAAKYIVNGK